MANVPNGVESLPKISIAWVGRTNVTDRQTTDRQTDDDIIANVLKTIFAATRPVPWALNTPNAFLVYLEPREH